MTFYYHHDHHGEHDHCCHEHHHDHDHEGCCHEHEHDHDHCCHEHEHHHDEPVRDPASLGDLEKARILLSHMLDHNQHHEEELAALAKRFTDAGDAATAKKIRSARARMVEANLALMEAVGLAAPKAEETSPAEKKPAAPGQEA